MEFEILERHSMAFKLKDGNIILIHEDDVKKIRSDIELMKLVNNTDKVVVQLDVIKQRTDTLIQILQTEKNMPPELREKYLTQILELTKQERRVKEVSLKEAKAINHKP